MFFTWHSVQCSLHGILYKVLYMAFHTNIVLDMAFYTMFFIWHPIQCSWHGIPYRQCWHGIPYRYSSLCAIPCRHHSWHDIAYSVLDMAVRTDTVLDMTLHTMFLTWQCIPTLFMTWHCIQCSCVLDMTLHTVFLTWHWIQCSWHDIPDNVLDMALHTDNALDMTIHTIFLT